MGSTAQIIFISNPYEPFKDTKTCTVAFGRRWRKTPVRLDGWLKANRIPAFTRPTICLFNGKPLMRKQWNRKIKPNDVINFVTCVGEPITVFYVVVALVSIASIVIALNVKVPSNLTGTTPGADPTFTLTGQQNQIRLGEPIEVSYGKTRMWPSLCAQRYNQYHDNQQWLYVQLSLGQGERTIHALQIEDTAFADFQDVQYEVVLPGETVTLFPTNVITSAEVAGIELLGPNESGGGDFVIDSEGDDTVDPPIPETGHYNAVLAGPFVLNPSGTQTSHVEVDVQLPRGLYTQDSATGQLNNLSVTAPFELQEIDASGDPVGSWFTPMGLTFSWTGNNITPQRFTLEADVTLGRYQIRGSRTSDKDTSASAGNTLIWEAARAFIPDSTIDPSITKLAVKARATNNLNDNSANRINILSTRKLPIYDPEEEEWSEPTETRSPVWAFCDAFRATYGAQLADQYLDLDALVALDLVLADREEYFDWIFEQKTTVWDIARAIAAVCRAVPMLNGSRVTMIRDDVKTLPVAVFNQENIVKNSFKWQIKLAELNPYDGLTIVYTDPTTWKEETVLCCLDDEEGNNAEQRKIVGITDRDHAFRLGMYLRAYDRYVRENFGFATGLEGHIPSYGDMIAAVHDVPKWDQGGYSGMVKSMEKEHFPDLDLWQYRLTLSEPFDTFVAGTRALLIRSRNGDPIGPFVIGTDFPDQRIVFFNTPTDAEDDDLDGLIFDHLNERPLYLFGTPSVQGKKIIAQKLAGNDEGQVEVEGRPYDSRLFLFDDAEAPEAGETHGHLPDKDALPMVDGLRVVPAPVDSIEGGVAVSASWFAMPGATGYLVEYSYDAITWEKVAQTNALQVQFFVTYRYLYVRVAALNTAAGDWAYWTGQAPIRDTSVAGAPGAPIATSVVFVQPDGTPNPRVKLSWSQPTDDLILKKGFIRFQHKLAADSDWTDNGTVQGAQTFAIIRDVKQGTSINVRTRSENAYGGFSSWQTPVAGAHTVTGDVTAPGVPTSVSAFGYPGFVSVTWVAPTGEPAQEYIIYRNTSNTFSGATEVGQTDSLDWDDPEAVPGTTYYYFVTAVDASENESSPSTAGSVLALDPPLNDVTPSDPTAPTLNTSGTYTGGDGTAYASLTFNIAALPADAIRQELCVRKVGAVHYESKKQLKNTSSTTARIDDFATNVAYDVILRAWSASKASSDISAVSSPFTTPTAGTPNAPTSIVYSTSAADLASAPPRFNTTGSKMRVFKVSWTASTSPDVVYYTIATTASVGGGPYAQDDNLIRTKGNETFAFVYFAAGTSSFFSSITAVSRSNQSSGLTSGSVTGNTDAYGTGTMAEQASSGVSVSGGSVDVSTLRKSGTDVVVDSRTVNGHALSSNVTVSKSDVGLSSVPNTDCTDAANITSGTLTRPINSSLLQTNGSSVDTIGCNLRVTVGGSAILVLNKDLPGLTINGQQVVGPRSGTTPTTLPQVITILQTHGLCS